MRGLVPHRCVPARVRSAGWRAAAALTFAAAGLAACSPSLDWRELRPQGGRVQVQLPCKPASHSRQVRLADASVSLTLYACNAAGATWALGFAEMQDPALVSRALEELAAAAVANVHGAGEPAQAWSPSGATPNEKSSRRQVSGRLPDGKAITQHVAVFALGTQVLQATVLGESLPPDAVQNFFANLKVLP